MFVYHLCLILIVQAIIVVLYLMIGQRVITFSKVHFLRFFGSAEATAFVEKTEELRERCIAEFGDDIIPYCVYLVCDRSMNIEAHTAMIVRTYSYAKEVAEPTDIIIKLMLSLDQEIQTPDQFIKDIEFVLDTRRKMQEKNKCRTE